MFGQGHELRFTAQLLGIAAIRFEIDHFDGTRLVERLEDALVYDRGSSKADHICHDIVVSVGRVHGPVIVDGADVHGGPHLGHTADGGLFFL